MKVHESKMAHNQAYEARGIVARYHIVGHYATGFKLKVPIYKFLTIYQGEGRECIPVEFKKPAPVVQGDAEEDSYLDIEALEEGDIVVPPALVYRRCMWNDNLMAAHMRAFAHYRPKTITVAEKADAPAFDLGTFDHTKDQVTKQ